MEGKWRRGRDQFDHPQYALTLNDGTVIAVIKEPSQDSYIPMWHYYCRQAGCGDNLGSTGGKAYMMRYARAHQREKHASQPPTTSLGSLLP